MNVSRLASVPLERTATQKWQAMAGPTGLGREKNRDQTVNGLSQPGLEKLRDGVLWPSKMMCTVLHVTSLDCGR